ncbi:hypothetical protein LL962_20160 [Xanthomonas sp. NCPPB 1067]|nr:hypothetical protein [Xanthomonas sp. NCPPB 1067]
MFDPLGSGSSILFSRLGTSDKGKEIACGANQTRQLNYTKRLMYDLGVRADR